MNIFKLSRRIINKSHIVDVSIKPKFIPMNNIVKNNSIVDEFIFFGNGSINSSSSVIKICQNPNKQDYDMILLQILLQI
jgi:hypothetical protein